jgi:hypothetical protein
VSMIGPTDEVTALVGKTMESLIDFPGVPKGTRGRVVQARHLGGGDAIRLVLDWELEDSTAHKVVRDSLTLSQTELRRFLQEVK